MSRQVRQLFRLKIIMVMWLLLLQIMIHMVHIMEQYIYSVELKEIFQQE